MDPVSSVALYHFAVLGERIDDLNDLDLQDIPIIDSNGTIIEPKTAEQIVEVFAKGAVEEDHVDLIGAQVVLYGSYYDDDIDKDVLGFIEEWDMYDKNFNRDLNGYIINEFESQTILIPMVIYIMIESVFRTTEADYYSNRAEFVDRHYRNKYGRLPFTMQSYIGVNKMWTSRNLGNVGVAADFIFNLVREPTIPGTLGRLENLPTRHGIPSWYIQVKSRSLLGVI